MGKLVAVLGCAILPNTATDVAVFTVASPPDPYVTGSNKGAYAGVLNLLISGVVTLSMPGFAQSGPPVSSTISGTAATVTLSGKPALLEGDQGSAVIPMINAATGATTTYALNYKIAVSGQTYWEAS